MSLRGLQHTKSNRIEISKGVPSPNEGNNGELRLGITSKGIFLYAKYGNRWYQIGDAAVSSGGNFSSQGVASQGGGTLATSIDRGDQSLKMGGNIVLSGNSISDLGSNLGIKFTDSTTARVDVANTKIGTNGYLTLTDNQIDVSSGNLTLDASGYIHVLSAIDMNNYHLLDIGRLTFNASGGGVLVEAIRDEDDMASDESRSLATQQSIKAYVDSVPVKSTITTHNFYSLTSSGVYIPFGGSQTESTSTSDTYQDDTVFIAPYNGTLKKIVFQNDYSSTATPGNVYFKMRRNGIIGSSMGITTYATYQEAEDFVCTTANTFSALDKIRIYMKCDSAPRYVAATMYWEFTE